MTRRAGGGIHNNTYPLLSRLGAGKLVAQIVADIGLIVSFKILMPFRCSMLHHFHVSNEEMVPSWMGECDRGL